MGDEDVSKLMKDFTHAVRGKLLDPDIRRLLPSSDREMAFTIHKRIRNLLTGPPQPRVDLPLPLLPPETLRDRYPGPGHMDARERDFVETNCFEYARRNPGDGPVWCCGLCDKQIPDWSTHLGSRRHVVIAGLRRVLGPRILYKTLDDGCGISIARYGGDLLRELSVVSGLLETGRGRPYSCAVNLNVNEINRLMRLWQQEIAETRVDRSIEV
jgi:hypothetical protein